MCLASLGMFLLQAQPAALTSLLDFVGDLLFLGASFSMRASHSESVLVSACFSSCRGIPPLTAAIEREGSA